APRRVRRITAGWPRETPAGLTRDSPRRPRATCRPPGSRGAASHAFVLEHRDDLGEARHCAIGARGAVVFLDVRLTAHRRHAPERCALETDRHDERDAAPGVVLVAVHGARPLAAEFALRARLRGLG